MTTQTDPANVRTLVHDASGAEVESFFGCILDVNQSAQTVFPLQPVERRPVRRDAAVGAVAGPQRAPVPRRGDRLRPRRRSPAGADARRARTSSRSATSRWSRPTTRASVASRRIPNTFEVRPTPAAHAAAGFHDELMIDWGNVPDGSVARIYLPDTAPDEVLDLAKRLYRARAARSGSTGIRCRCRAGGITYVPVPAGAQINHAGLLTIDLPAGVKQGQRFHAVVRQLTHVGRVAKKRGGGGPDVRRGTRPLTTAAASRPADRLGARARRLPGHDPDLEPGAAVRRRGAAALGAAVDPRHRSRSRTAGTSRSARYVQEIGERVGGFGGDPGSVEARPERPPRRGRSRRRPAGQARAASTSPAR